MSGTGSSFVVRKVAHSYVAVTGMLIASASKLRSAMLPCGLASRGLIFLLGNLMCAKLRH